MGWVKKCWTCVEREKYVTELESDKRIQANMIRAFYNMVDMMVKEKKITSSDLSRYMNEVVNQTIEENGTK